MGSLLARFSERNIAIVVTKCTSFLRGLRNIPITLIDPWETTTWSSMAAMAIGKQKKAVRLPPGFPILPVVLTSANCLLCAAGGCSRSPYPRGKN
jgi:hypothetical protein